MLVIVYGHTGGDYVAHATEPFNPKQLGVAFFVFVMGYSLARETRPTSRALYNRLFDIYLFGWLFALVQSLIVFVQAGDLNESNYLPLLLGVNVLFDSFPANPTTWYVGTYLHLLLLWALLIRGRRLSLWWLAVIVTCEIAVRALLIDHVGNYVAYMALTNWLGALGLGTWAGQNQADRHSQTTVRLLLFLVVGAALLAWSVVIRRLNLGDGFPFMRIEAGGRTMSLLATSASVSWLYLGFTWVIFEITRRLPDLRVVRFFARNTIVIFIAHMPLLYALAPYLHGWIEQGRTRVIINLIIYYGVLAVVSELICRAVQPKRLRDQIWSSATARFPRRRSAAVGSATES
jgi:hypothetical protein